MQQKMSQHIDDQRVEGVAIAIGYRDGKRAVESAKY